MRRTTSLEPALSPYRLMIEASEGGESIDAGAGGGDPAGDSGDRQPVLADWNTMVGSLPSELRDSVPDLATTKDFPSFVKQYKDHRAMIGKDRVSLPGENAPLSETYEFFKKLGRPDKPEDYDLGDFGPPEGLPWDDESMPELLNVLHRAGLNNTQVRQVAQGYVDAAKNHWERRAGNLTQMYEDADRALKREWGNTYDANMDLAHRAWNTIAGEDFDRIESVRLADGRLAGDHPVLIRMMALAGQALKDHGLLGEGPGGGPSDRQPGAIRAKINALMASEKMKDSNHPQHHEALTEWNALIEALGDEPLEPGKGDDFL